MKLFPVGSRLAVFVVFCVLVSVIVSVYSADVLGVNEGDWALYTVISTWKSAITNDTVPPYAVDINQTTWKVQVEEVWGVDRVRLSVTKYLKNGTRIEIYEGSVRSSNDLEMWVVRKSLGDGDLVYDDEELTVNSTGFEEFAGAERSEVYAWFSKVETDGSVSKEAYAVSWDGETGILCGMLFQYSRVVEDKSSLMRVRIGIVETSLWEPSSDGGWFLGLLLVIIVLVLAVLVFVWRRVKSKRRKVRKRSI
jgi:hypothetical protein